MRKALFILLLWGVAGCSFVFQELNAPGFNEKLIGMKKSAVQETIGNPETLHTVRIENKDYEVWTYRIRNTAKINKVGYTYYQVIFLGDIVKRWEKIRVYSHPSFEYEEPKPPSGHVPTLHFQ